MMARILRINKERRAYFLVVKRTKKIGLANNKIGNQIPWTSIDWELSHVETVNQMY